MKNSFTHLHHLFLWIFLVILITPSIATAQKRTISGYVMDASSQETMIGATIFDGLSGQGCTSNSYGFYSLTLEKGQIDLQVSYVGYELQEMSFDLRNDTTITIKLKGSITLNEVVVEASRSTVSARSPQMSVVELPVQQIKSIPTLFGEADVLKAIQLLPGVQNGSEGSAGLYVRGGGPDENLLLLDGVPVYNVNHMMGFFSVFNPDALKNVTFYKGSFPAHFGGRLSSVVDVRMKDGNMREYHGNVSVGAISSKINVEGPIIKDKLSFNFSFRRTYLDLLMRPIIRMISKDEADIDKMTFGYYFYDFNGKLNWKLSDKDRLFLSVYSGDDVIYMKLKNQDKLDNSFSEKSYVKFNWSWGNKLAALRWNHVNSSKLFMNTTVTYTQYRHNLGIGYSYESTDLTTNATSLENLEMAYKSGINDITGKVEFDYAPNPNHEIKFGGSYIFHYFRPEVQSVATHISGDPASGTDFHYGSDNVGAHETSLFAEDNFAISPVFKLNAGLHYSTFTVQGKFYHSLQPRFSMSAMLAPNFSIKAGYAYMSQYIHMLSNSSVSLPTDLWVPVTSNIEPMKSHQVSLGGFYEFDGLFDVSLEGYFKSMNNLLEYRDGTTFFGSSEGWENKVCIGRGWSYGIEFLVQRSFGKTTGWLAYTWAHAKRKFDREGQMINNGEVFPAKYDRRHDVSITAQHKFSDRFDLSGTFLFSTGNCGTLGMQVYEGFLIDYPYSYPNIVHVERNNFRYANYLRFDLSANFNKQKKHGIRTWNVSIYNVTAHNNPFMVYVESEQVGEQVNTYLKQVCIFPFIPSISYGFKF